MSSRGPEASGSFLLQEHAGGRSSDAVDRGRHRKAIVHCGRTRRSSLGREKTTTPRRYIFDGTPEYTGELRGKQVDGSERTAERRIPVSKSQSCSCRVHDQRARRKECVLVVELRGRGRPGTSDPELDHETKIPESRRYIDADFLGDSFPSDRLRQDHDVSSYFESRSRRGGVLFGMNHAISRGNGPERRRRGWFRATLTPCGGRYWRLRWWRSRFPTAEGKPRAHEANE